MTCKYDGERIISQGLKPAALHVLLIACGKGWTRSAAQSALQGWFWACRRGNVVITQSCFPSLEEILVLVE